MKEFKTIPKMTSVFSNNSKMFIIKSLVKNQNNVLLIDKVGSIRVKDGEFMFIPNIFIRTYDLGLIEYISKEIKRITKEYDYLLK